MVANELVNADVTGAVITYFNRLYDKENSWMFFSASITTKINSCPRQLSRPLQNVQRTLLKVLRLHSVCWRQHLNLVIMLSSYTQQAMNTWLTLLHIIKGWRLNQQRRWEENILLISYSVILTQLLDFTKDSKQSSTRLRWKLEWTIYSVASCWRSQ